MAKENQTFSLVKSSVVPSGGLLLSEGAAVAIASMAERTPGIGGFFSGAIGESVAKLGTKIVMAGGFLALSKRAKGTFKKAYEGAAVGVGVGIPIEVLDSGFAIGSEMKKGSTSSGRSLGSVSKGAKAAGRVAAKAIKTSADPGDLEISY